METSSAVLDVSKLLTLSMKSVEIAVSTHTTISRVFVERLRVLQKPYTCPQPERRNYGADDASHLAGRG